MNPADFFLIYRTNIWAKFRTWITSSTCAISVEWLLKHSNSNTTLYTCCWFIPTCNRVIITAKTMITEPYHHCVWLTCDICIWRDRYCVQGSKLVSTMLDCITPLPMIATVSPSESYQTLQEPGWPGDDDEDLLDQFGDDSHLLTLWALVRLIRKGQKDDGLLLWL